MKEIKYIRCYTCGKHFPEAQALGGHFCSETCMGEYARCPVCRKYFLKMPGWLWGHWCSEECSQVERGDKSIEVTL